MSTTSTNKKYLALNLGNLELDLAFVSPPIASTAADTSTGAPPTGTTNMSKKIVLLLKGKEGTAITFNKEFLRKISDELAQLMIIDLEIDINSVLFAIDKKNPYYSPAPGTTTGGTGTAATGTTGTQGQNLTTVVFGANLGFDIGLSGLPLVGDLLPGDKRVGIDNFQLLVSNNIMVPLDVNNLRAAIPPGLVTLPGYIAKGANVTAVIRLAGLELDMILGADTIDPTIPTTPLPIPPAGTPISPAQQPLPPPRTPTQPGLTQWFTVNKTLGPLTFKRVGGRFYRNEIHLMLDAQLALGPITFALEGLSVGTSITKFDPKFNLDGMAVAYANGPVIIAGGFLRDAIEDSYNGFALIKVPAFAIGALGAYQKIDGQTSLFIYAFLTLASGIGPAFLQINGISIGFGYNRSIKVPDVTRIKYFPLVGVVTGDIQLEKDPMSVLRDIKQFVPAAPGELFFAVGIKFSSFKLIHAFALLIVSVGGGDNIRLDLLGIAKITLPTAKGGSNQVTPLAQVELALKASFDFGEGKLEVAGALTPASFILSRKCVLFGGFAFNSWFKGDKAGDFVFTAGGYHPAYKVPAHYPNIPRLGFLWQLIPELSIKGGMYAALTPTAFMAGGRLEALFQIQKSVGFSIGICGATLTGIIRAYLVIGADFIISWQPFYYDANIYLNINIGVTFIGRAWFKLAFITIAKTVQFSFDISLSANMHIWGPEFAGTAHVDWSIVSFDIAFGAKKKEIPKTISWPEFKAAFLPPPQNICSIAIEDGIIKKDPDDTWIVNPAELVLTTHTVIPSTGAALSRTETAIETGLDNANTVFGISTMGIEQVSSSIHTIIITDADANEDVTDRFLFTPILKSAPDALWGKTAKTDIKAINDAKDNQMIPGMLMGFTVTPGPKKNPNTTEVKPVSDFSYDIESRANAFNWAAALSLTHYIWTETARRETIQQIGNETMENKRNVILNAMGLDTTGVEFTHLPTDTHEAFLVAPQVVAEQI